MSEPTPVAAPRPYRSPATEEPWHAPEPGARPRPADSLTGLAAELSTRLNPPDMAPPPPPRSEPAPRASAAPPTAARTGRTGAERSQSGGNGAAARSRVAPHAGQPPAGHRSAAASRTAQRLPRYKLRVDPRRPTRNSIQIAGVEPEDQARTKVRCQAGTAARFAGAADAGQESLRKSRRGDGQLAGPSVRKDVTVISDRRVRLVTVAIGVAGLIAAGIVARCRAGYQRQFRTRQRPDRARDPDDRAAHGAVAGAVDPRDDDVVHAHRGGAVAAAHRARHRHRPAQCGDRLARAVPHRLRDGPGAATRLRHRHPPADRQ